LRFPFERPGNPGDHQEGIMGQFSADKGKGATLVDERLAGLGTQEEKARHYQERAALAEKASLSAPN
jgi:hypothetical protein